MPTIFSQLSFEAWVLFANSFLILVLIYSVWHSRSHSLTRVSLAEQSLAIELLKQRLNESSKDVDALIRQGQQQLFDTILQDRERQLSSINGLRIELEKRFSESTRVFSQDIQAFKGQMSESLDKYQQQTRQLIEHQLNQGVNLLNTSLDRSIKKQSEVINHSVNQLTETTNQRLNEISGQVEKRLSDGFEKTTKTFTDILQRLALIDDAQKKITELSSNVVSLQEVLNDKRSRGAFGEVQLESLISNTMPQTHYKMQQHMSNGKIADCVLLMPKPTGKIAIDAKFPLESYRKMTDIQRVKVERQEARKQFVKDIRKHIIDIASKYVLPPETADGAVMFIPAESVFAEIHGFHPELIELAHKSKVWLVSPTTLMAILTTASAVIKDEQTRQQVHVIKQHLGELSKDFSRFQGRMDNLSKHIGQAYKDVEQVHVSARKISSRFEKIERVEVEDSKKIEDPKVVEDSKAAKSQEVTSESMVPISDKVSF